LMEQEKILDVLNFVDNEINQEKEKIIKYNKIKKGLMYSLLLGKIRVELRADGIHRISDG